MSASAPVFENGLSVPGPSLSPLTLGQIVDEAARKSPTAEYLYDVPLNLRLTYGQLKTQVDLFASGLLNIGLNPGDRIRIWGPNVPRTPIGKAQKNAMRLKYEKELGLNKQTN